MNTLLRNFEKINTVEILAKRWFQKSYGNTYFSAEIYANGNFIHKIDFQYGYGDQYLWACFDWLKKNGYLKYTLGNENHIRRCFEYNGIEYFHTVSEVHRKKDL